MCTCKRRLSGTCKFVAGLHLRLIGMEHCKRIHRQKEHSLVSEPCPDFGLKSTISAEN